MPALDSLAGEPRWVAWRNERRGDKLAKIPYAPDGRKAKADDPSTWGTRIAAETRAPPAEESAISTSVPPASLETQGKSKAKSNTVPAPTSRLDKTSLIKPRRTYVPGDARRTTPSRSNPSGR